MAEKRKKEEEEKAHVDARCTMKGQAKQEECGFERSQKSLSSQIEVRE